LSEAEILPIKSKPRAMKACPPVYGMASRFNVFAHHERRTLEYLHQQWLMRLSGFCRQFIVLTLSGEPPGS
jgi:hypothetical protein